MTNWVLGYDCWPLILLVTFAYAVMHVQNHGTARLSEPARHALSLQIDGRHSGATRFSIATTVPGTPKSFIHVRFLAHCSFICGGLSRVNSCIRLPTAMVDSISWTDASYVIAICVDVSARAVAKLVQAMWTDAAWRRTRLRNCMPAQIFKFELQEAAPKFELSFGDGSTFM